MFFKSIFFKRHLRLIGHSVGPAVEAKKGESMRSTPSIMTVYYYKESLLYRSASVLIGVSVSALKASTRKPQPHNLDPKMTFFPFLYTSFSTDFFSDFFSGLSISVVSMYQKGYQINLTIEVLSLLFLKSSTK